MRMKHTTLLPVSKRPKHSDFLQDCAFSVSHPVRPKLFGRHMSDISLHALDTLEMHRQAWRNTERSVLDYMMYGISPRLSHSNPK